MKMRLRLLLIAAIIISIYGCSDRDRSDVVERSEIHKVEIEEDGLYDIHKYEGYWTFPSNWSPWKGGAIEIKGDKYKYWFRSDVGGEIEKYPYEGKAEVKNGVLRLYSDKHLYSKLWYLVERDGKVSGIFPLSCLWPVHVRDEKISDRMMILLSKEVEPHGWPIMNFQKQKAE